MRERLDHRIRRPGAGSVESFLRGIELVHDQQRLATLFLECHRGDRPMGVGSLSLLASINLLLPFQFLDNLVQLVEPCNPELAVPLDPCRLEGAGERRTARR